MKTTPLLHRALLLSLCSLLAACAAGPDFLRPELPLPAAYREAPAGWKLAETSERQNDEAWWTSYGDPRLDQLIAQASIANQNVLAAEAQYRQAQAVLSGNTAALLPTLGVSLANTRSQSSSSGTTATPITAPRTTDRLSLNSSWEIDLWGRLRRQVESGEENLQASVADLAAVRLSVQATLVQSYLALRINDAQQRLLSKTLGAYRRSFEITRNRREAGIASQADVAQAESQLRSTEAQAIDLGIQRTQLEHAIAILTGRLPTEVRIEAVDDIPELPAVPPELPSALLERRPDIAAAERRVAAANAQIGVAQAAFFPSLGISASGGYQNNRLVDLVSLPHRVWSVGPSLALSLFDGGARSSLKAQAVASYDRSVANYRQTVLNAFQEVEDNLAALRILDAEKVVQQSATAAARRFQEQTDNQYLAGTVSFLNVATAQAAALSAERASLDLLGRQLNASVALFRALGGARWQPASP